MDLKFLQRATAIAAKTAAPAPQVETPEAAPVSHPTALPDGPVSLAAALPPIPASASPLKRNLLSTLVAVFNRYAPDAAYVKTPAVYKFTGERLASLPLFKGLDRPLYGERSLVVRGVPVPLLGDVIPEAVSAFLQMDEAQLRDLAGTFAASITAWIDEETHDDSKPATDGSGADRAATPRAGAGAGHHRVRQKRAGGKAVSGLAGAPAAAQSADSGLEA